MLGILVAGRFVQTDFQQIGENQFLINVPDADNINHIVVFLTGTVPFPDGMGGAVYFSWPDLSAPPNWQFLGYISNNKPSAIFKISTLKKNHEFENSNVGIFGIGKISHVAQIGVSVEPLAVIEQQAAMLVTTTNNNFIEFAEKMLTNFMNYVASFTVNQTLMTPNPMENFVPLSSVHVWYETFQRRFRQNPSFWKTM
ncbi:protein OPI10 homolog [Harpegnathos saltator]|uniref:Protein OPI10-like protein n=1 Tax=Harpegnathos saltator TaxID=610380 RepID=E2BYK7_HARSA|nr:protein OPI10 homolog [Harpegnathos saltator]EFN79212.1 Protein OPI10-like protein [Harpegnathos saltator]